MKGNQGYKLRTLTCSCGTTIAKRMSSRRKWCSLECYRKAKDRPARKTGTYLACKTCGTENYRKQFCSKSCHNAFQSRNKLTFTCKTCGEDFQRSPSIIRLRGRDPIYCGIPCRTACPDWKFRAVIKSNHVQQNRTGPNKLEVAGNAILDALGIIYQTEVLLEDRFTVDAFIPDKKIVIQWDGDYWHGFDTDNLSARQQKRRHLDASQNKYLTNRGYLVLRFWEHEVNADPGGVAARVDHAVNSR